MTYSLQGEVETSNSEGSILKHAIKFEGAKDMNTRLTVTPFDRWFSGVDNPMPMENSHIWNDAPEERNQIAKGILYSLPISALLWGGLLAMLLLR